MKYIDSFINKITMYRLVLYYLIALFFIAIGFGLFGILPYTPTSLIVSAGLLLGISWGTNIIFAKVFQASTNSESVYITALILFFIITPFRSVHDLPLLVWAAVWAMASKYIFAIRKKHIFNPVAIAVVITAFGLNQSASWWVGNAAMMGFVVVGGLLIVRKIRRESLVFSFFFMALLTISLFTLLNKGNLLNTYQTVLLHSSLFFLAFVMLTEPLTTPPTKKLQIMYGAFVGFLFAPQVHVGTMYSTPELALVVGNVFAYLVSSKQKLFLTVMEKMHLSEDLIDFVFSHDKKFSFVPGQYLEWTLPHKNADSRGNRRYFTIASSPTEKHLRLGVKFYEQGSTYKRHMANMDTATPIIASQLAGDFTLPKNPEKKCVFIAGGIGITPFRSMIKYAIDTNQKRPIVLFYANKIATEIAYKDVFDAAEKKLGIRTIYTLTDKNAVPANWQGNIGRIDAGMIQKEVPDYKERTFYLSGPPAMIEGFEKVLKETGIKKKQIKKDYFPGFV
jgi:ferredoxin-NADP reductase